MAELKDLQTKDVSNWCPGCGNFGIQVAIKQAIVNLKLNPENVVVSTGIGCGSKINQWIETYGFAGLHGRSVPVAMGIKLANPELTVIDAGGDGDGYGIGMAHFMNTMRRNIDMTYIVENNQLYALTLGQVSPTSDKGMKSPSTPHGVIENPVNPIRLALSGDATFVARGFSGDIPHLTMLIEKAIKHRGFSFIDIFQPCVTFNKINTYDYFRSRVYKLEDDKSYKTNDLNAAFIKAGEIGQKIPIGLFYQIERPTYEDSEPGLVNGIPVKADITDIDVGVLMESFM
ncbi:MAG: 2-oxoacid:ferredoxin oxidoreductase subunit beta [Candidatus Gracilibacteria bacterium]|jgi:2-oxoglutarate ferredoxin oxidoreductase subunit beta